MFSIISGSCCCLQAGKLCALCMGLTVDMLSIGSALILRFAVSTKLLRFSLPFPKPLNLLYIGWSVNLLNFSACCWALLSLLSCIGCKQVIFSSSLIGVVFRLPVMIRIPWFWTLLILLKFDLAAVAQAAMPYSSTGLTRPVYNFLRTFSSAPHVVPASFFMIAIRCLALVRFFSTCVFHVRRRSKVTPR